MKQIKKIALLCLVLGMLIGCFPLSVSAINSGAEHSYMVEENYDSQIIPKTYNFDYVIDGFFDGVKLSTPQDLFVSEQGELFIADTGNNRIIRMNSHGELVRIYKNETQRPFNGPKGVFVDEDGFVYVADTNNKRLVKMTNDGKFVGEIVRPTSDLISDDISFEPSKLMVCDNGLIYVIVGKEFMSITQDNEFLGYFGAEDLPFSLSNMLVNMFASDIQKQKLTKKQPSAYNNFALGSDGLVYAVANKTTGQIKKITSVGENIYEDQFYGEYVFNQSNVLVAPTYTDIAVDKNGIVFVCETNSRKIYQYDRKGNSVAVFGGEGATEGYFSMPVAVDVNREGQVFVLDSDRGAVQVFSSTRFMTEVLEALRLFEDGEYDEAYAAWNEIVRLNAGYPLAHNMLGAIEFKRKNYEAAMDHFEVAGNQEEYGEAYGEMLHALFTRHFAWVVIGLIALVFVGGWGFGRLKKLVDKWNRQLLHITRDGD
ncbi:MAG: hypothetical protein IJC17_05695 [Clostridia bacterium]|nr:hypothetical protein [Clostridia bacterium]